MTQFRITSSSEVGPVSSHYLIWVILKTMGRSWLGIIFRHLFFSALTGAKRGVGSGWGKNDAYGEQGLCWGPPTYDNYHINAITSLRHQYFFAQNTLKPKP